MRQQFTHIGIIEGIRALGEKPTATVRLVEGKKHWISQGGVRFKKTSGWPVGDTYAANGHLNVSTVKAIDGLSSGVVESQQARDTEAMFQELAAAAVRNR